MNPRNDWTSGVFSTGGGKGDDDPSTTSFAHAPMKQLTEAKQKKQHHESLLEILNETGVGRAGRRLKQYVFQVNKIRDLVVCGCAKCGSTSMYHYIYKSEFEHIWPYNGQPWIQTLKSPRWAGKWTVEHDQKQQKKIMEHATSFALIRDPKERLVSSWKSKVTCNENYGVDIPDRNHFVPELLRLRGANDNIANNIDCLNLLDFCEALRAVQVQGKSRYLNQHFLPQNLGCFKSFPPNTWTAVGPITDSRTFTVLAANLRKGSTSTKAANKSTKKVNHMSTKGVMISEKVAELLDLVTVDEYEMLGRYLTGKSRVQAGNAI